MEWMLDTANLEEIRAGVSAYPLSGVTTNPTILRAEGKIDYIAHLKAIRALCPGHSFHVQLGADTCAAMLEEAEMLRGELGEEVYLKIPVTREGLAAIGVLAARGVHVTATAIYYPLQGMLAASAGAEYLAPYCNRMEQNEIDFGRAIAQMRAMIDRDGCCASILAASFKNAGQVTRAIESGAHAVTVQPALLRSVLGAPLVMDAVQAFGADQAWVKGK